LDQDVPTASLYIGILQKLLISLNLNKLEQRLDQINEEREFHLSTRKYHRCARRARRRSLLDIGNEGLVASDDWQKVALAAKENRVTGGEAFQTNLGAEANLRELIWHVLKYTTDVEATAVQSLVNALPFLGLAQQIQQLQLIQLWACKLPSVESLLLNSLLPALRQWTSEPLLQKGILEIIKVLSIPLQNVSDKCVALLDDCLAEVLGFSTGSKTGIGESGAYLILDFRGA